MLSGKDPSCRDLFIISVKGSSITGHNAFTTLLLILSYPELLFGFSSVIDLETSCSDAGVKYIFVLLGIFFEVIFE